MSKKKTTEEITNTIEPFGLKWIGGEYIKNNLKNLECEDSIGYKYMVRLSDLISRKSPNFIDKSNPYTLYNIQLYLKNENKNYSVIGGEYIGRIDKTVHLKCNDCKKDFTESWERLQNQKICCPDCRKYRKQEISKSRMNDISDLIEDINKQGIEILNPEDYNGMHFKLNVRCLKEDCRHEWEISPNNALRRSCPKCNNSKKSERYRKEVALILEQIYSKNKNIEILNPESYVNGKGYFNCYCKKHNKYYEGNIGSLINGSNACEKCHLESIRGENSKSWNPNRSIKDREYARQLYDENGMNQRSWSKEILKIYNYTCILCNNTLGKKLRAHHIKPWAKHKEIRYDLKNGVCLCECCHDAGRIGSFHDIYGTNNCTERDFYEYYKNIKGVDFDINNYLKGENENE